ncbi:GNAT family N-acetyltransferase [Marinobacter changyiensis]|uniref:GNAT family N-acetyltransferase n=1 Tax=Marinobacter changyiensis TaxID=2604091 RepID=UPI0012651F95|nr:GNAT family N-acetyltransferase [Marinobacter changyiensis]
MSLFQTDAWQRAWWETWGEENRLELVRDWAEGRTGIYTSTYRIKGFLPVRSIEFVGSNYRKIRSTRTEYNTFSTAYDTPSLAIAQLKKLMDRRPWAEAIFNDLIAGSDEVTELLALARNKHWLIRVTAEDIAWKIRTDRSFDDYLKSLGRNTRLRLYNRRPVLESIGSISHQNVYENNCDPSEFFRHLNDFHQRRWGKPVYGTRALAFNTAFLKRVVSEGGEPQLLALRCDDQLISVLYNVKYQGCVYNLQSGFDEDFHPKLAVGTLHLGYAIERAFREGGVHSFDMLAGSGKNENYKQRLATENEPLVSLMLVRHPILKLLYRLKDRG